MNPAHAHAGDTCAPRFHVAIEQRRLVDDYVICSPMHPEYGTVTLFNIAISTINQAICAMKIVF
jgi:hypothetical protein